MEIKSIEIWKCDMTFTVLAKIKKKCFVCFSGVTPSTF